jgi:hypothetical protein
MPGRLRLLSILTVIRALRAEHPSRAKRLRKNREQDVPGPLIKRECLNGSALQNDSEQRRHFSLHSRLKEILDGF